MDSLMDWRRSQGCVGCSINVAAVSSVAVAADLGLKFDETINTQELMLLVEEAILSDRCFTASASVSVGGNTHGFDRFRKKFITGIETKVDLPLFELLGGKAIKSMAAYMAAQIVVTTDSKSRAPNGVEPHDKITNGEGEKAVKGKKHGLNETTNSVNSKADAYFNGSTDTKALLTWWQQYLADVPTSDPLGHAKAHANRVTSASTRSLHTTFGA
ncbi:hypothetical protein DHEL01_v202988 [Diaporthe helianthi]|uniref:Uncharacterized protein n=1 Tax=Diaporthe helianthi TaxID=158607 RepID=A0A2P5I7Y8_DIAHE|nr:hypothetical protein DHEL01_v202988 [Diaporthe helianthi]